MVLALFCKCIAICVDLVDDYSTADMTEMKRQHFNEFIIKYRNLRRIYGMDLRSILDHLIQWYGSDGAEEGEKMCAKWRESVVYSLIAYEFKCEIKQLVPKFIPNLDSLLHHYYKRDKSLIALCEDNHMSYAIACQHILQHHNNYDKNLCKTLSTNTSLISDGRLAFDVMLCNVNDIIFGNHCNHMTNNTGIVFESEVSHHLNRHDVSYMSESQLRTDSFDVTPDFKLNLPLIVKISKTNSSDICLIKTNHYFDQKLPQLMETSDESDYEIVVINWIECKSMFASELCHSKYYRNQYSSYINRFGNGLVLYKYGFVNHIRQQFKHNIIVSHRLPPILQSH
ncbi:unnamed protein product [Oppiella nova]|uniref:CDAN1-interacting nuclease 1 n=1 Tax=Oppiella nova TaxID=334625 RepID=A0A7R9LE08_9ACAR|nr:unnamed protein product [Oppiella nova]CAG2162148.1 unnamed protein product [Oppiella nova]